MCLTPGRFGETDAQMTMASDFLGKWQMVSGRLGAATIPLPEALFTIEAEHYQVDSQLGRDEGRLEWLQGSDPQAVNLAGTGGAHAGARIEAIIRVRGRVLQLCYAVDGSRRPRDFEPQSGAAVVVVRYRRAD